MLLIFGLVRTSLGRNCHVKLDFSSKKWRCAADTDWRGGWPAALNFSTDGTFEVRDNGVIWLWDQKPGQQKRNTAIIRDAPTAESDTLHMRGTARFYDTPQPEFKDIEFPWAVNIEQPASYQPVRMVIVDRGAPKDAGFLEWLWNLDTALLGAQLDPRSDWVSSVSEMSTRVYFTCADDRKLTELFIFGHGVPGFQSIGAGPGGVDASGLHSIALDPGTGHLHATTAMYLRGMRQYLAPDAVVTLGGCHVAGITDIVEGEKSIEEIRQESKRLGVPMAHVDRGGRHVRGTRLLMEVSEALGGVWVLGSDENQRYLLPGLQGRVYWCKPNLCSVSARPYVDFHRSWERSTR
jgi:hypothetical protein